jgi:hypothetical protein
MQKSQQNKFEKNKAKINPLKARNSSTIKSTDIEMNEILDKKFKSLV